MLKISAKLRIQVVASQKDASGGHVRPEVTNSCKKGVVISSIFTDHECLSRNSNYRSFSRQAEPQTTFADPLTKLPASTKVGQRKGSSRTENLLVSQIPKP